MDGVYSRDVCIDQLLLLRVRAVDDHCAVTARDAVASREAAGTLLLQASLFFSHNTASVLKSFHIRVMTAHRREYCVISQDVRK